MKIPVFYFGLTALLIIYLQLCKAGLLAIKVQNLFALKQALLASRLPIGQQVIFMQPALGGAFGAIAITTRRPNATVLPTTTRPAVIPPVPAITTQRPGTIISIQQLFPGAGIPQQWPGLFEQFPVGIPQQPGILGLPQGLPGIGQQALINPGAGLQGIGQLPISPIPGVAQQAGGIVFPGTAG